jgi:hypothetical protein
MSRSHFYRTVQSLGGALVSGASVTVCEEGTTTPIAQTMYTTVAGADELSNPFLADGGVIDFYLDDAQDIALVITFGSSTLIVDYQPVLPPAEEIFTSGAPMTVTNGPSNGFLLIANDATHASWQDPSLAIPVRRNIAMPQPSLPVVLTPPYAGVQLVVWDGLDVNLNPMPDGFSHLVVLENGTSVVRGSLLTAGTILLSVDGPIDLVFQAINEAGVSGDLSDVTSFPAFNPPTGPPGPTGPANTLIIGTVTTGNPGSVAAADLTGVAPNQTLDLTIPKGDTSGVVVVNHDGDPNVARPVGAPITYWIGGVRPANAIANDLWFDGGRLFVLATDGVTWTR